MKRHHRAINHHAPSLSTYPHAASASGPRFADAKNAPVHWKLWLSKSYLRRYYPLGFSESFPHLLTKDRGRPSSCFFVIRARDHTSRHRPPESAEKLPDSLFWAHTTLTSHHLPLNPRRTTRASPVQGATFRDPFLAKTRGKGTEIFFDPSAGLGTTRDAEVVAPSVSGADPRACMHVETHRRCSPDVD